MRPLFIALPLAFCLSTTAEADETAAVIAAQEAWEQTLNGDDPAAAAAHFLPEATLLPQGGGTVEGTEAIVAFWEGLISGPGQIDLQMVSVDLFGDVAIENGTFSLVIPAEDGGETRAEGKTLVVWQKDGDGRWRMLRDMWNDGI